MLGKDQPERAVPWISESPPNWTSGFRPRVFLDIGCGLGAVTTAVLTQLGHWGCLTELRRVVLIDRDSQLHPQGTPGLRIYLANRIRQAIEGVGLSTSPIEIEVHVQELFLEAELSRVHLRPLSHLCAEADMILASHVTYYFSDGSGHSLAEALLNDTLAPQGRLWVIVRDFNCPVYRARREILDTNGVVDPQPFDYSEHFGSIVIPRLPAAVLLAATQNQLSPLPGEDRARVAQLMMWRREVPPSDTQLIASAEAVARCQQSFYSETHFILGALA